MRLNNQLLISTMLNLIHYDGKDYHIVHTGQLSEGTAHYNGITWDENQIYVSACDNFRYKILVLDKSFNVKRYIDNGDLHETHQIIMGWSNLYCVNTGKNRVDVLNFYSMIWGSKSFNPSPCDIDHLNGIWFDNEYFYISEFRHKQENQPSVIRKCNHNLDLIGTIEIGLPIHNVYCENNKLYCVVSRQPGIYELDLANRNKKIIPIPNLEKCLVRGLARTKNNWFIGASNWERDVTKRHIGDGIVLILDNNFNEIKRIVMENMGPVCDIRVLDELDLAHNGVEF